MKEPKEYTKETGTPGLRGYGAAWVAVRLADGTTAEGDGRVGESTMCGDSFAPRCNDVAIAMWLEYFIAADPSIESPAP
jgi:hypothetical protein